MICASSMVYVRSKKDKATSSVSVGLSDVAINTAVCASCDCVQSTVKCVEGGQNSIRDVRSRHEHESKRALDRQVVSVPGFRVSSLRGTSDSCLVVHQRHTPTTTVFTLSMSMWTAVRMRGGHRYMERYGTLSLSLEAKIDPQLSYM